MINPSTILQKYKEEQERKAKKARPGRSLALTKLEELNQVRFNEIFKISEGFLSSNISQVANVKVAPGDRAEPRFLFYAYTETVTATSFTNTLTITLTSCTPSNSFYPACG